VEEGRQDATERRTTVAEAASVLGISAEAVRGRIRRGTLPVEREGGAVYVLLGGAAHGRTTGGRSRTTADQPTDRTGEVAEVLQEQNAYLREQLRREQEAHAEARRIIAGLVQRMPQLEAPQDAQPDAPGTPERGEAPQGGGDVPPQPQAGARRPWWRRVFGG
jgi:hypothetical protein